MGLLIALQIIQCAPLTQFLNKGSNEVASQLVKKPIFRPFFNYLKSQIDQTQDIKAINELQARIAAEQSMIANEQIKLQLAQKYMDAEERIQEQRAHEASIREASKTGTLNIKSSDFKVNR